MKKLTILAASLALLVASPAVAAVPGYPIDTGPGKCEHIRDPFTGQWVLVCS